MPKKNPWWPILTSFALLLVVSVLYATKPVAAYALTIFPAWTWLPMVFLPTLGFVKTVNRRALLGFAIACLAYCFAFSEEWVSLKRTSNFAEKPAGTIRVALLNCAGGSIEAAREVEAFKPDLVLLTESPGEAEMAKLSADLWGKKGSTLKGPDGSILCRGTIQAVLPPKRTADFTAAKVTIDGSELNIVALRLNPPAFRVDIYNPDAWSEVASNAKERATQLKGIADFVATMPRDLPTIVAGDFNCQPGSYALNAMPKSLRDAFYEAGAGWGHTAVNDYPLARIDQIWISPTLKPSKLIAQKTLNSDHRMVICNLSNASIKE